MQGFPFVVWEIVGEPAKMKLEEFRSRIRDFDLHRVLVIERYEASGVVVDQDQIVGLSFGSKTPPPEDWRRTEPQGEDAGYWEPPPTPEGRKELDFLQSAKLPRCEEVGTAFLTIPVVPIPYKKLKPGEKGKAEVHAPGFRRVGGRWFILAREEGQWKPIKGLKPIKASEYLALTKSKT
jgi:hypothetical protein